MAGGIQYTSVRKFGDGTLARLQREREEFAGSARLAWKVAFVLLGLLVLALGVALSLYFGRS